MTTKRMLGVYLTALLLILSLSITAVGQSAKGAISGRIVDSAGAVLPGARIDLQPRAVSAVTNGQGEFTISDLPPGEYTLTVHYVGFSTFSQQVTVAAGQAARVDATLKVATASEEVIVYADRARGEAEAINRELSSDNILQVLPVEVITSLPNTNIADALSRLPSVTLERDEGEGKYVQIRGTEPRFSNVTINGVNVPSPQGDVRQIKLDIIPANLVDSVEISKTLSANQDGDAIGGSVNLVTKTAGERPTIYLNGIGGYTPIVGGRMLSEFDGTVGQRFGANKKLGILIGGSYDWNGRGIDDIEPSLDVFNSQTPIVPSIDLREYRYYRTRYGFSGSVDYKLGDVSGVYARFLYSHFDNFGDRWVYSPETDFVTPTQGDGNGDISFSSQIRRPVELIGSLQAGGRHVFNKWLLLYDVSVSRASSEDHGYSQAKFDGPSGLAFNLDWSNPNKPKLIPQGASASLIYDPTMYTLSEIEISNTYSPQLNLQGSFSAARTYSLGGHFGTFEFGGKFRNAHKFEDAIDNLYDPNTALPMSNFLGNFHNTNYYDGSYTLGPLTDFGKIRSFFNSNQSAFDADVAGTQQNTFPNGYDLIERVSAGYLMNTLQFGRVRLQTGVRFEGTNESLLGYQVVFDSNGNVCPPNSPDPNCNGAANGIAPITRKPSYLDVLPSVQVRFGLGQDSAIRASYGRGIARPNFNDLPPTFSANGAAGEVDIGNPSLKPTHANNFDLLFEQYLRPLGIIQGGVFYKQLSDPIYRIKSAVTSAQQFGAQYVGDDLVEPVNGSDAHLFGFEIAYQQHLSFLPGLLSGVGIAANYGYTKSRVHSVPLRTDSPALQRQAPNTWNVSPTFDRGRLSLRAGISHNDANIFEYNFFNVDPTTAQPTNVDLGLKGPNGDVYLYSHTQVDAQGSFRMYRGLQFIVAGLNLTNEVFGFYQGSPRFPIQREFYKPSYEFGLRYTFSGEGK